MLPAGYRGVDSDTGSVLYLRYGAVATVSPRGHVKLLGAEPLEGKSRSQALGKYHVERYITANGPRLNAQMVEMRERMKARGFRPRR